MRIDDGAIRAIALIDNKIQSLRQQLRAFEEIKQNLLAGGTEINGRDTLTETPMPGKQPQTRKEQVVELMRLIGPLRRGEIKKQTGMPAGTVSYCLKDDAMFRSLGDGRWDVVK